MWNTNKYKNVENSSNKKQKILIVLIISLLVCLVIKYLIQYGLNYLRERKLNISFVFITQIYFAVSKNIKLNSTILHYKIFKQTRASTCRNLVIPLILTLETLRIFTKMVLQNHIFLKWLILLLHQIILHISEKMF